MIIEPNTGLQPSKKSRSLFNRLLDGVEKAGNKLPDEVTLADLLKQDKIKISTVF